MKVLAIGDIHGEMGWKDHVGKKQYDHVVFIGDYFDSFNLSVQSQIYNFNEIVNFKQSNPDNVTLLAGNHDFHYMIDDEMYSGFNSSIKFAMQYRLLDMVKDGTITMAHSIGKYLFSHAGISEKWCENQGEFINYDDLVNSINDLFKFTPRRFTFSENTPKNMSDRVSYYGDNNTQSPIWIRPKSLSDNMVKGGWHQIVGHTHDNKIMFHENLTIIDSMPHEALLIDTVTNDLTAIKL
jgi:hypothetical protein